MTVSALRLPIVVGALSLALLGFGCRRPEPTPVPPLPLARDSQPSMTNEADIQEPRTPDTERPTPHEVKLMREALANLTKLTSFRATVAIPTGEQKVIRGDLEVNREGGWHGTLTVPGTPVSELYVFGSDVYVKNGTSSWTNVGLTGESARLATFFSSALAGDTEQGPAITILDSAKILSTTDDPSGCLLYAFSQGAADGSTITARICVADKLPTLIAVDTPTGPIEIRYRDFNQEINLWPPTDGN